MRAVVDSEAAISRLNAQATGLVNTEPLARILLRAESVASSRIEGLEIAARRLLRAEVGRVLGEGPSDVTAVEVLRNIEAMTFGISQMAPGGDLGGELVLETNRRLLEGTRLEEHGGKLRENQNWIGGSSYNPCSAASVPPPPEYVPDLIEDLVTFCNDNSLPAVVQAAIAPAQFETIHPFVDGNGRTGRALVHLVFRRRGIATRVLPPVSLILATWAKSYIGPLRPRGTEGRPRLQRPPRALTVGWLSLLRPVLGPSTTPSTSSGAPPISKRNGGDASAKSGLTRLRTDCFIG